MDSNGSVGSADFPGCNSWHDDAPCHFMSLRLKTLIIHASSMAKRWGRTGHANRFSNEVVQTAQRDKQNCKPVQTYAKHQAQISWRLAEDFRLRVHFCPFTLEWLESTEWSLSQHISSCLGLASPFCLFFSVQPRNVPLLVHILPKFASTPLVFGHRILHFSRLFFSAEIVRFSKCHVHRTGSMALQLSNQFYHVVSSSYMLHHAEPRFGGKTGVLSSRLGPKRTRVAKHLSYKDCKKSSCHKLTTRPSSLLQSVIRWMLRLTEPKNISFFAFSHALELREQPHIWKPNFCFSMARTVHSSEFALTDATMCL